MMDKYVDLNYGYVDLNYNNYVDLSYVHLNWRENSFDNAA